MDHKNDISEGALEAVIVLGGTLWTKQKVRRGRSSFPISVLFPRLIALCAPFVLSTNKTVFEGIPSSFQPEYERVEYEPYALLLV